MRTAASCLALTFFATMARADPANNGEELRKNVVGCMKAYQLHPGSEATVVFRLHNHGAIIGIPRIDYAKLAKEPAARQEDAETIADALHKCFPTPIGDAFGALMAGHPYTYSWGVHLPKDL